MSGASSLRARCSRGPARATAWPGGPRRPSCSTAPEGGRTRSASRCSATCSTARRTHRSTTWPAPSPLARPATWRSAPRAGSSGSATRRAGTCSPVSSPVSPARSALTPPHTWGRAPHTCGRLSVCRCHSELPGETTVAPFRRPRHVVPSRYDLRLEPDLATLTFRGEETVAVTVAEATDEVVFNAVELAITEATIQNDRGESLRGVPTMDEATERCRVAFPSRLAPGGWRLSLAFTGRLNDKLRGFYRSSYKDASGATHLVAATQFEATDARRAFPCWDEPAFKAVVAVTLAIDPALTAVSNTSVVAERREGGKKVLAFADTILMSTYLVAFVAGELEATDSVLVRRAPVRVWCVPGKLRLAAFGHAIAVTSLRFFETYYGLPYPGDKLDLLAIPDFAAGAMENLGAITFPETALLVDERAASHPEPEPVADVVAPAKAHLWVGDLGTMRWWDGIWRQQAFPTFMEILAIDAWKPEW